MSTSPKLRIGLLLSCLVLVWVVGVGQAQAQWELKNQDGSSSVKFGLLLQPQAEFLETADGSHYSQNLFLRRARILIGGQVMDKLTFFFETDSPNLGKGEGETKNTGDIYIQDFFATYSFMDELKIDGGLMLPPSAYNHLQSAATVMPVDYMPYTFTESTTMQERVGRDYGVQARGYVAKHFEYRAGVFQGSRDQNATRPLRWNARVAYHVFDQQTGYFYTGTSLATKHYLTFGASYDAQNTYKTYAFDAFWDQPVGPGAFTLQVDYQNFDGGDDFPSLPKQGDTQVEAGFYFKSVKLTPYATWSDQSYSEDLDATGKPLADTSKWMLGIAWFPFGHKFNLKLAGGQLSRDFDAVPVTGGGWEKVDAPNRTVFQLQAQIFVF